MTDFACTIVNQSKMDPRSHINGFIGVKHFIVYLSVVITKTLNLFEICLIYLMLT